MVAQLKIKLSVDGVAYNERLEKYVKLQLTTLRILQVNDQHNLEHRLLRVYVYIYVYNSTTRMRLLPFAMKCT